MKPFLLDLAEKTLKAHGSLNGLTIVFPNRRAVLYFRKHLSSLITKPSFSPVLCTIEDFFATFSPWHVPDRLELVHRLYKAYEVAYAAVPGSGKPELESFDRFYFWGDMLLRDFDEVDKYMIPARQLFKDLSNQKELDSSFDFLTEDQKEFLLTFWGNFGDHLNDKRKFHLFF